MASNAALVLFRIAFGLLMLLESWGAIATGWVHETFVEPRMTFPLRHFEWLDFLAGPWMFGYFAVMGCAALGVLLGWRYRATSFLLALMWTGVYLAQSSHYNNHYYLAVLVAWGFACFPAHRDRSLDVAAGRVERATMCDAWIPAAFRLQLLIVFSYASIAKLYPGWLSGDYLRTRLQGLGDRWLVGDLLVLPWFQMFLSYSGIAFDALVIPALFWRRTRWLALGGLVVFNLFNSLVFQIGIFPYMVLAFALFFFEDLLPDRSRLAPVPNQVSPSTSLRVALVIFFALQVALPLRHHLIPGDVNWTEEGHRMSWRMMLRTKRGSLQLEALDPSSGERWRVEQERYLTPRQRSRIATRPDFLYQFVQRLKRIHARDGHAETEIYARRSSVSLNGAPAVPLFAPDVDLARVTWSTLGRDAWVLDQG